MSAYKRTIERIEENSLEHGWWENRFNHCAEMEDRFPSKLPEMPAHRRKAIARKDKRIYEIYLRNGVEKVHQLGVSVGYAATLEQVKRLQKSHPKDVVRYRLAA